MEQEQEVACTGSWWLVAASQHQPTTTRVLLAIAMLWATIALMAARIRLRQCLAAAVRWLLRYGKCLAGCLNYTVDAP
jgi:hypothetical protein